MPRDHLGPLDPRFPISLDAPSPVFWQALRPWQAHSHTFGSEAAGRFADLESRRAVRKAAEHAEAFVLALPPLDDPPAVTFTPVPYPQLEEATLAHEYATRPGDATLTEIIP
jgi:hypothetical protein